MKEFDQQWKVWIWKNVGEGCSKEVLFKVLLDSGFSADVIERELDYQALTPLDDLVKPLAELDVEVSDPAIAEIPEPSLESGSNSVRSAHEGLLDEAYQVYLPRAKRLDSEKIELYTVDHFFSSDECDKLCKIIEQNKERSSTTNHGTVTVSHYRTSESANLSLLRDEFVDELDMRLSRYMGFNWTYGEGLQGQSYSEGEEFKLHLDAMDNDDPSIEKIGQRTWTFMLFLNDVKEGGETQFPHLDLEISPSKGKAVIWRNLDLSGKPNPYALHAGKPVSKGAKVVITKWFRQKGEGVKHIKEPGEYLPTYTSNDFQKVKIPEKTYKKILDFYKSQVDQEVQATDEATDIDEFIKSEKGKASSMYELPPALRSQILVELKPILAGWSGMHLLPSAVYGIRTYHRGAALKTHLDTYNTHIISANLNIAQNVDSPWTLEIEDSFYRTHKIHLKPGEMLLYESARLHHSRAEPLDGESFSNVFVHYSPVG